MIDKKFIKFLFVGGVNTLFGYSVFALLIWLGFHYSLAVFFGTIIAVLFNFKTTGWVFKNNNNILIFRFIGVYAFIALLNTFILWLFKHFGFENMYITGAIVVLPMAFFSFYLMKKFVFVQNDV